MRRAYTLISLFNTPCCVTPTQLLSLFPNRQDHTTTDSISNSVIAGQELCLHFGVDSSETPLTSDADSRQQLWRLLGALITRDKWLGWAY
ncbi:hypothetical protein B0T17DRAFT_159869 [Bombardia bombarda]|uniref:Uncharacterized protein n=1 Tax=Bombardia bombarda TaxID=252184 RepID=A0AA39X7I7_9PEZI|nr:hypothetical protein B0T17DRAFT_159869 [Bombardia bombarda]